MNNPRVEPIWITFLTYAGNMEYFLFLGEKQFDVDIIETGQVRQNIFPDWPKSYGETAYVIDKKTFTRAKNKITLRSQHLTRNQRDVLKYIKTSTVVQIVISERDRIDVLVDSDSFKIYDEAEKLYSFICTITYTDEIAAQSL